MRIKNYLKKFLVVFVFILLVSGCSNATVGEDIQSVSDNSEERTQVIVDICLKYFQMFEEEDIITDLQILQSMIDCFGENGYSAVDSRNQVDMSEAEQVDRFCKSVSSREEAEVTIIEVDYLDGIVKYDLYTQNGKVDVTRSYYKFENGQMNKAFSGSYQAEYWNYTEEGYLMFSGSMFSEDLYALSVGSAEEHKALRVSPLDKTYRELNRKYLLPIGYEKNNMFLVNWSEDDYGELDFYDMFDILYPKVTNQGNPYLPDENLGVGAIYHIPKEEFEKVIMQYFNVDSDTLQSKTNYTSEKDAYEYKPRGFYEVEYPEYPYSEVVGFKENDNGTISLSVNVVFPYTGNSKVYAHEVVVRPLEDGGMQYVSNTIITPEANLEDTWHTPRLSNEEWEDIYGGRSADKASIFEAEEKTQIEKMVLKAAGCLKEEYADVESRDGNVSFVSDNNEISLEQRRKVTELLGEQGYISVADDVDMQNGNEFQEFYGQYLQEKESKITIFEVLKNGFIGTLTFLYRDNEIETYYVEIGWQEGGNPIIADKLVSKIDEIKLTEKGYFIYKYACVPEHASLRQYWRIKPLPKDCQELSKHYLFGMSYQKYNLFIEDWNIENVEDILMPGVFDDLYRKKTGETFRCEGDRIPAEIFEGIMTNYLPVTVEQLKSHFEYDNATNTYCYEQKYAKPYPPFGEVVDYMENEDGTITLIVDGVWTDYNSDLAFRNTIVVQPLEDGSFRYLSNSIEQMELEPPKIYSYFQIFMSDNMDMVILTALLPVAPLSA